MAKSQSKMMVNIPAELHAVLKQLSAETGRNMENLTEEALRTGMRIKRWLPEAEPEPAQ